MSKITTTMSGFLVEAYWRRSSYHPTYVDTRRYYAQGAQQQDRTPRSVLLRPECCLISSMNHHRKHRVRAFEERHDSAKRRRVGTTLFVPLSLTAVCVPSSICPTANFAGVPCQERQAKHSGSFPSFRDTKWILSQHQRVGSGSFTPTAILASESFSNGGPLF